MQRRTQGVVALGASAVLGVVAGVLVVTTGPGRELDRPEPHAEPVQQRAASSTPSSANNPAAVPGAPDTTPTPVPPTTRSASPTPTETDNRGRGQGRGGNDNSGSGSDNSGSGSGDDDDSGSDG